MSKKTTYRTQFIASRNEVLAEIILAVNETIISKDKEVGCDKEKKQNKRRP